jgi:L-amino acid N-acyltransferase
MKVQTSGMQSIRCTYEAHAPAILEIFNEAIKNSTAIYENEPRTLARMEQWFEAKRVGGFPVIGLTTPDGVLAGFASLGPYRPFPGFIHTMEHSVYVEQRFRGRGLGRRLLREIVAEAQRMECHVVIGAIDGENHASLTLHEKEGFVLCGRVREAGFKFGRWLDVVFYQKILVF